MKRPANIALAVAITLRFDGCITCIRFGPGTRLDQGGDRAKGWAWRSSAMPARPSVFHPRARCFDAAANQPHRLRRTQTGYLRLQRSWIAHSDRVGIPLIASPSRSPFLWIGALKFRAYEADTSPLRPHTVHVSSTSIRPIQAH